MKNKYDELVLWKYKMCSKQFCSNCDQIENTEGCGGRYAIYNHEVRK